MAVVEVEETTGRDGSKDIDSNKRYRRTWRIRTSSPVDGAFVVLAGANLPAFNDPYQYVDDEMMIVQDPTSVCVDIRVTQDDPNDPQNWVGMADYAGVEDPVAQPAEVEYSPTRYQLALVKDVNGKAVGLKGASLQSEMSAPLLGVGYIIGPKIAGIMVAGGVLAYLVIGPVISTRPSFAARSVSWTM